jgi:mannose-6-phosphate isomerase-like protein (cupin superfamily)
MKLSRRELALLAPLLAAQQAFGQASIQASRLFLHADPQVPPDAPNSFQSILNGTTHRGLAIELHETELGAGRAPHPPHSHLHEELLIIREGTLEVTIAEQTARLGAGSVAYIASGEQHGWRNVGETRARYLVLALGDD